jgi:hypothetical protein
MRAVARKGLKAPAGQGLSIIGSASLVRSLRAARLVRGLAGCRRRCAKNSARRVRQNPAKAPYWLAAERNVFPKNIGLARLGHKRTMEEPWSPVCCSSCWSY